MNLDLNTSMEDLYIGRGLYISEILDMYETCTRLIKLTLLIFMYSTQLLSQVILSKSVVV